MRHWLWIAGAMLLAACSGGGDSSGTVNDTVIDDTPMQPIAPETPDANAAAPAVEPTPTPSPSPTETFAGRPSFACSSGLGTVERMICDSAELAGLDRDVARAYAAARRATSGEERAAIEAGQREFLATRNACADAGCIADAYRTQREALPDMSPVGEVKSCESELGARRAQALADQCRQVSPATRPPCHPANACTLIRGEIKRGCDFLDAGTRPDFCPGR